eukprot:6214166-Pleurochrysis_carterae.AAC.1
MRGGTVTCDAYGLGHSNTAQAWQALSATSTVRDARTVRVRAPPCWSELCAFQPRPASMRMRMNSRTATVSSSSFCDSRLKRSHCCIDIVSSPFVYSLAQTFAGRA